jgi:hypothetical protein
MAYNTVKIKKYLDVIVEYVAAATITPGMLLEITSAGKVQAHSSAGQNVLGHIVALEDELQGNGIDDDYSADDPVQCWVTQRGEVAYMLLEDGEDVSIGDALESAGDGRLQKYVADTETLGADSSGNITTIYTNQIVAVALEAVDLSGSSGEESSALMGHQRIKVMLI